MVKNKVSIIIPVFNRAHLIKETLDSIRDQVFTNWECIVVDDRSTDDTFKLIREYARVAPRFKLFKRPGNLPKGANSCRNFGFTKAEGEYIIWFDSDDLMTPDHIQSKVREIQRKDLDFLIARTQNFQDNEMLEPYTYIKKDYGIKASDFILLKIHWYTYDVVLRKEIAQQIKWNENMKSWQDYNYFCKMLLATEKGAFLDEILTHRRIHSHSIQKSLTQDLKIFNTQLLENRVLTYNDISEAIDAHTRKELVFGMMNICFELSKMRVKSEYIKEVDYIVGKQLGVVSQGYFKMALITARLSEKGHYFLNRSKKRS